MKKLKVTASVRIEILIFRAILFKFGNLIEAWKLATNAKFKLEIFKIKTARPPNTVTL